MTDCWGSWRSHVSSLTKRLQELTKDYSMENIRNINESGCFLMPFLRLVVPFEIKVQFCCLKEHGQYFPVFGLNTEIYGVKYGKYGPKILTHRIFT